MDGRSEAQGLRPKAQEAQEALRDSQLDREIESAVGIEPSPEFLARVRMRIAADPALVVESGFSRIRRLSFEPLWALAIAGIVLALVIPGWMREGTPMNPGNTPVASKDADRSLPPEIGTPAPRVVDVSPVRVARATAAAETPLRLSPVLFSEDERRALQRLVMAVEEGLVPPLPETTQAHNRVDDARELRIEPLMIDPLPVLARGQKEGEGQW